MVRRVVAVGTVEPLGSGATGAVLMSAMQKADRKAAIAEFSPTPRARRTLEELIEHVSQYGWALAPETWVPGLCGISAAVRDEGEIVATVSISGPSNRFTPEIAMSHVELLTASAHDLSLQLGAHLSETYMELGVNRSVKQARNSRTTA
jgi:DNA-binding IclR family transcriptional regulator